jgi:hypothetical protein
MAIQRGAQPPSPVGDLALLGCGPESSTACPFVWSGTYGSLVDSPRSSRVLWSELTIEFGG